MPWWYHMHIALSSQCDVKMSCCCRCIVESSLHNIIDDHLRSCCCCWWWFVGVYVVYVKHCWWWFVGVYVVYVKHCWWWFVVVYVDKFSYLNYCLLVLLMMNRCCYVLLNSFKELYAYYYWMWNLIPSAWKCCSSYG